MAKYNSKSVYGTLFTMLNNLSQENQDYLMENVFDGDFLEDIKSNPKKAYDVLNKVVINIEDGKTDKVSELLSKYKDKIYMMKNMLKNYGNFEEKKFMAKYDWKIEKRDEDWSDDTYAYFLIHINLKRMVEYLTKEFKKDWWFKADYGQDNCYIVAENNNFPVRLFFTFDEGGWADITRHYTDDATYKDDHLGSWHFGKYDIDYSYAMIRENIEEYFYRFEESMKENKKSLTERDDSFKSSDVKRWMISGGDVQITFKDGNELVGLIAEYRKDETDSKAECFLCEDITSDYTGNYFIVESYNGKIISIKFQSFDYLTDYMDKNDYELVESMKGNKKSLKESSNVTRVGVNFDGNENLMDLFAPYEIYDSTKYDYDYKEIAKAFKKVFGKNGIDEIYISDKNTLIIISKFGELELIPKNEGFESISDFELYLKGKLQESKKSLKEYRTVGFEQLVRDTIVSVLEDPHSDLFDMYDVIITYDNKKRAKITSNGDIDMDFITLPLYAWSSGSFPLNKKTEKLFNDIIDYNMKYAKERLWDENKDELIELGITDENDERIEYNTLYDLGAGDLAEELSEYEMDLEGTELFTDVYCELEETDEGIELTITMTVDDEYGHALVKDYKPNTVLLQEDADDLEEFITDAIRKVTEQF